MLSLSNRPLFFLTCLVFLVSLNFCCKSKVLLNFPVTQWRSTEIDYYPVCILLWLMIMMY